MSLWNQQLRSGSAETVPERVDGNYHLPDADVGRWTRHQVAGSGCPTTPQVSHCFEAFQEVLPRRSALQSAAVVKKHRAH
jgi:hypothetical protein